MSCNEMIEPLGVSSSLIPPTESVIVGPNVDSLNWACPGYSSLVFDSSGIFIGGGGGGGGSHTIIMSAINQATTSYVVNFDLSTYTFYGNYGSGGVNDTTADNLLINNYYHFFDQGYDGFNGVEFAALITSITNNGSAYLITVSSTLTSGSFPSFSTIGTGYGMGVVGQFSTNQFVCDGYTGMQLHAKGYLQPPSILSARYTNILTGGFSLASYYYYVITAWNNNGETNISAEITALGYNYGPWNAIQLTWKASPGALGYNIYRTQSSGDYTNSLVKIFRVGADDSVPGYTARTGYISFADGNPTPAEVSPPGANSASAAPMLFYGPPTIRDEDDPFSFSQSLNNGLSSASWYPRAGINTHKLICTNIQQLDIGWPPCASDFFPGTNLCYVTVPEPVPGDEDKIIINDGTYGIHYPFMFTPYSSAGGFNAGMIWGGNFGDFGNCGFGSHGFLYMYPGDAVRIKWICHPYDGAYYWTVVSYSGYWPGPGIIVLTALNYEEATTHTISGWHACDGSAQDGATPIYAALFQEIGANYGHGADTSITTFNLPNLSAPDGFLYIIKL
jgi:Phage Tail Collar Domain